MRTNFKFWVCDRLHHHYNPYFLSYLKKFIEFPHPTILVIFIIFMRYLPNFHKPTSLKIRPHDMLWKNWQTQKQQHFMSGMSCSSILKLMPTSRSEQKQPKNHVTKFQLKFCNSLIIQNFERIFQGITLIAWPMLMRRSSACKEKPGSWRKKIQNLLPG